MKYLYLFLSMVLLTMSCQKNPNTEKSDEDILINGKWAISGGTIVTIKPRSNPPIDTVELIDSVISPCLRFKTFTFQQNSAGFIEAGPFKCMPSDPDQQPFNWSLSNNGNTITILNATSFFDTSNLVANVTNLSRTGFTISYKGLLAIFSSSTSSYIYDTAQYNWNFKNIN